MKIAVISSNTLPTPPNIEIPQGWTTSIHEVVHNITEGLVEKAHDVTLFASGDSITKAKLISPWEKCSYKYEQLNDQFGYGAYDAILASYCFEKNKTENYDIIYSYSSFDASFFANLIDTPIVGTYHGAGQWPYERIWPQKIIKPNKYVAISKYQAKTCDFLKFEDVIYNGIDPELFKFKSVNSNNNLVFVGRISTEKGTDIAAKLSRELNIDLDIFGTTNYQPLLDEINALGSTIKLRGQKSQEEIASSVANSKLFIFPSRWNEPFGLVLAESLACGTPIVGFANGSLPEIIEDGKTGFLVNSDENSIRGDWIIKTTGIDGLKEAINKIYSMPEDEYTQIRKNCRDRFEKNFTKEIMINNYENLFEKIINENKK